MKVIIHENYQPLFSFVDKPNLNYQNEWEKENTGVIHRDFLYRLVSMSSDELKEMFDTDNFELLYEGILEEKELSPAEKRNHALAGTYEVSVATIKRLWKEAENIVKEEYGALSNFYGVVTNIFKNKIKAFKNAKMD